MKVCFNLLIIILFQVFHSNAQSIYFEPFSLIIWSPKGTELQKINERKSSAIKSIYISKKFYKYSDSSYSDLQDSSETMSMFFDKNGINYNLSNSGDTVYSIKFDKFWRPVQTRHLNHSEPGNDSLIKITSLYYYSDSFGKLPDRIKKIRTFSFPNDTEIINYRYQYYRDSRGQLIKIECNYNNNTIPFILDIDYDSFGRVVKYHEHNVNGYTPWDDKTFFYNTAGKLVKIINCNTHLCTRTEYIAEFDSKGQLIFEDLSPDGKGSGSIFKIKYQYSDKGLIDKCFIEFTYTEKFRIIHEYQYQYY